MKHLALLVSMLLLSACGSKITGTYADKDGLVAYEFGSNGKVTQRSMGIEIEFPYELDGDKVKLQAPTETLVLTRQGDGSLQSPWGRMAKQ